MKEIIKNKKILYIFIVAIIIIGIISIFVLKLNFSLMYSEHTQIEAYLGKAYDIQDIKKIAEETFGKQEIIYQEIETFHDAVAISVKQASDEQISTLETKLKEKYQIEETKQVLQTITVPHLRGRDILKPYIMPIIFTSIIILIYIAIRYMSLGTVKVTSTLLLRLIVSEALFLSIIGIARIPISVYTMPLAILLYIAIVISTAVIYENKLEKNVTKETTH